MHILFISPLIPARSGTGGKRAVLNHLLALLAAGHTVDLVAIDLEGTGEQVELQADGLSVARFDRHLPRLDRGLGGILVGVWQMLTSRTPRTVAIVQSPEAMAHLRARLEATHYDLIVYEHLMAAALVPPVGAALPVVYIAQNVEAVVARDQWRNTPWHAPIKLALWLEWRKTLRFERQALARASAIVAISGADAASAAFTRQAWKVLLVEELPAPRVSAWRLPASRRLLFVGGARYFPNRDALDWLTQVLMPSLQAAGSPWELHVAGTSAEEMGALAPAANVTFHGFVPDETLVALHLQADAFICPVVLGSGVKVKLLEAAAYGMPLIATAASTQGSRLLENAAIQIDRAKLPAAVATLVALQRDPRALEAAAARVRAALQEARATALSLPAAIEQVVGRHVPPTKR